MGKQLRRKYSSMPFENNNPGCMSGVFHILDFHQWHNVKKMLPHRRHGGGRHPRGLKSSKMDPKIPGTVESPELTDAEVDNIFVDEKMTGASPTNKKSSKARMKALIAEDMSREDDLKCQISAFSANSQLLRTDSIHHLEPSDHDFFDERNADGKSEGIDPCQDNANISATSTYPLMPKPPEAEESVSCNKQHEMCGTMNSMNYGGLNLIDELRMQLTKKHALLQDKLDKAKEAFLKQKPMDGKDLIREASFHQSKEFLDALEIFNINKELFLQILQDPDSALANQLQNLQISDARIKLTKSGSFPVACLSGRDNVRPSILMHKQKEIGFFGKQEGKLQAGNSPRKLTIIKPSDDFNAQPLTSLVDESEQGKPEIAEHGTGLDSSLGSPHELKSGGENRVNRFKDIKQRIKHAIKGSRKEHQRISMDAILHRIPYGRRFSTDVKESVTDRDGKDSPRSSFESDGSMFAVSKGGLHRIRRAASLNESLDRYSQLLEFSFSREAKRHLSDRVKLTNEDGGLPGGRPRKALGRILSLPELDSNFSLQSGVSRDALYPGTLTRIHVDTTTANVESCSSDEQRPVGLPISTENGTELEATVDSESQQNLVEENENCPIGGNQEGLLFDTDNDGNTEVHGPSDNLDNQTMGENSCFSHHEQEIGPAKNACIKQAQPSPISVLDSHFEDDLISPAKVFTAEGSELIPRSIDFNELDSMMILQDQSGMDSPCENGSRTDFENVQNLSKHFDSDLPHVQVDRKDESDFNYVRDVLKLSGFCGNEYLGTWQLPDQPVDPSLFEEVECRSPHDYSGQEAGGSCDHQLLFDLINEVLLDIYERSFTYWPRPLSFNHHIRPKPVGYHLLEEVWANISWYLRSQPGLDQSLDCVMARDLAKADGWMNLQFETECVGLELEEWILDELLEDVTCELAVV